jgi:energy-coupling factor transporter ATP-binding protein EcfA2
MTEGKSLVVVGESGAGKTTLLHRAFGRNPAFAGYGLGAGQCALVSVNVRGPCTYKSLGRQILKALDYPLLADRSADATWDIVFERVETLGVRFLHFDEAHNIVREADILDSEKIRNALKSLLNGRRHPVSLILSGTCDLAQFLATMVENKRHSRFQTLPSLTNDDVGEIGDMVRHLAGIVGLAVETSDDEALAPRLIHASLRQLGAAIELTHEAIEVALMQEDGALRLAHYVLAYDARTGSSLAWNPFSAAEWAGIDCSKVLVTTPTDPDDPDADPPKPRRAPAKKRTKRNSGRGGY